jgi:LacI family transcriptional regulator, gluconate utilization system Gnt-I transcriptional repressor
MSEKKRSISPRLTRRVTLEEIAGKRDVGIMTVSRALNRPHMVAEPLRQRILDEVERTGYVPNRAASGLASGGVALIPVIVPTLQHSVYVSLLDGLHSVLPKAGFEILISCTEYMMDCEERLVADLLGWNPRGIILSGIDHSTGTLAKLKNAKIPVIEVMDTGGKPIDRSVGFSHEAVGSTAAKLSRGSWARRNIVYAGKQVEIDGRSVRRVRGFQRALAARRLPAKRIESLNEAASIGLGRQLLSGVLEKYPETDAIFFGNDDLAAGALFECQRRSIKVPERIAILGFNDLEIASEVTPALSSIATPRREIGRLAGELLIAQMEKRSTSRKRSIDLGFHLVERASTKAIL